MHRRLQAEALIWHAQVSIVSQEPILFAESILYNITFGVQDPSSISLAQVRPPHCADTKDIPKGIQIFCGTLVIKVHGASGPWR